MKVILLNDVKKQGKKGDIIEVKDGYGTYLINNHLAVKETKGSTKVLNDQKEKEALRQKEELEEALKMKKNIENMTLVFKVQTGKDDRVFGTISTKQICDELKKKGLDIDKRKIKLDVAVNTLGVTKVLVQLHKEVLAELKVELKK